MDVEMNSLFGQQGSWKGTSKITMMAVFEERKKPSTTHRWPFLTVMDSPPGLDFNPFRD
jgi:hypothetical protein